MRNLRERAPKVSEIASFHAMMVSFARLEDMTLPLVTESNYSSTRETEAVTIAWLLTDS